MPTHSFYDKMTGALHSKVFSASMADPELLALNTPDNHLPIEGHYDHESQRVDLATGQVIDAIPTAPDLDHQWDEVMRRWVLKPEVAARQRARQIAQSQIEQLEARQGRPLRELALNPGDMAATARLGSLNEQIAAIRAQLS